MTPIPPKCITRHQGEELVCAENGRRMIFLKPKERIAEKIQVDPCIGLPGLACDYLVRDWKQRNHFVELKGKNVSHALDQIEATIPELIDISKRNRIRCFVVCSGAPATTPAWQVRQKKFRTRWNAELKIKAQVCEHILTDD